MTVEAVEMALHALSTKREARGEFRDAQQAFLGRFNLTADEQAQVAGFDVRAMQAVGVSPLLTMGYWMTNAPDRSMRAYLGALAPEEAR